VIVAWLVVGGAIGGLGWLGWRSWELAFWDRQVGARHRPRADQVANQEAVEAYWAHHPRMRSLRYVRRGRAPKIFENPSVENEQ
jgi:hypothetical protein